MSAKKATPSSSKSLKKYYRADRNLVRDANELLDDIGNESDRSAITILAAVIEDALTLELAKLMRKFEDDNDFNEMFGPNGPLGTFSSKIRLSYALKIVDRQSRDQLGVIRELRNAAAHSQRPISFEVVQIQNVCLRMFAETMDPFFHERLAKGKMRETFSMECLAISMSIKRGRKKMHEDLAEIFRDPTS